VDNEKVGTSPPDTQIAIPAGRHRIEVRNKDFAPFDTTVELKPNEVLRIKHHFVRR
jgi:serine/threonine-protein kinase